MIHSPATGLRVLALLLILVSLLLASPTVWPAITPREDLGAHPEEATRTSTRGTPSAAALAAPPAPTGPPVPDDAAVVPSGSWQQVSWTSGGPDPEGDPVLYRWEVATDVDFALLTASGTSNTTTSAPFQTELSVTYFWHARAEDPTGNSSWSPMWRFATQGLPDLRINPSDYAPPFDTSFVLGRPQDFRVIVWNAGETPATNFLVALYLDGSLNPLASALVAEVPGRTDPLSPGSFTHLFTGIMLESVGTHVIRVMADADDRVTELNEAPNDNEANVSVTVSLPRVNVSMDIPSDHARITPGTSVPVTGRVTVAGQIGRIVPGVIVTVRLQDASGAVQGSPVLERTDPDGNYFASLSVPAGLPVGTYTIVANVTTGVGVDSASVTVLVVNPPSTGFVLPGLAFIGVTVLIVGAVLASVLVWSISRRPRGSPPGPHP